MRVAKSVLLVGVMMLIMVGTVAAKSYQEIDAVGLKALMDKNDALVVFPLSPIEFDDQHIKGSVNIPLGKLAVGLPQDKSMNIVFYCLGLECIASWRGAEQAAQMGYKNVFAFREGLPAWQKAGYPLVSTNKLPDVEIKKISTESLAHSPDLRDAILLDVNMEKDADTFYIDHPNRLYIPLDEIKTSLSQIPKDRKIIVICLKGKRSPTAVKYLVSKGYQDVVMVEGGAQKWVMEGRPVKK